MHSFWQSWHCLIILGWCLWPCWCWRLSWTSPVLLFGCLACTPGTSPVMLLETNPIHTSRSGVALLLGADRISQGYCSSYMVCRVQLPKLQSKWNPEAGGVGQRPEFWWSLGHVYQTGAIWVFHCFLLSEQRNRVLQVWVVTIILFQTSTLWWQTSSNKVDNIHWTSTLNLYYVFVSLEIAYSLSDSVTITSCSHMNVPY